MIPKFNHAGVLPPFVGGSPTDPAGRAPYRSDIAEFVDRFGTSPARLDILEGLLRYRHSLSSLGLTKGFQWIDGSFVEDCESRRGRPPGDVDLVTFLLRPDHLRDEVSWTDFLQQHTEMLDDLFNPAQAKEIFRCDAYLVELDQPPEVLVELTHYWFGLFTHSRETAEWKGIIRLDIFFFDPMLDKQAGQVLAERRTQCPSS